MKFKATGACFENAARYITGCGASDLTLVHCTVTGKGAKVKGLRYAHAFIIAEDGVHAIDLTKDINTPIIIPLDYYRHLGEVSNEIHYTRKETSKLMVESEHYGPWDQSVETDVDRSVKENAA